MSFLEQDIATGLKTRSVIVIRALSEAVCSDCQQTVRKELWFVICQIKLPCFLKKNDRIIDIYRQNGKDSIVVCLALKIFENLFDSRIKPSALLFHKYLICSFVCSFVQHSSIFTIRFHTV